VDAVVSSADLIAFHEDGGHDNPLLDDDVRGLVSQAERLDGCIERLRPVLADAALLRALALANDAPATIGQFHAESYVRAAWEIAIALHNHIVRPGGLFWTLGKVTYDGRIDVDALEFGAVDVAKRIVARGRFEGIDEYLAKLHMAKEYQRATGVTGEPMLPPGSPFAAPREEKRPTPREGSKPWRVVELWNSGLRDRIEIEGQLSDVEPKYVGRYLKEYRHLLISPPPSE
ncbi:MAG: hypothetical protein KDA61_10710, partial [Planctomycetales bacterium]|nr:hypothetical protein [Planctomycetales bacterium]